MQVLLGESYSFDELEEELGEMDSNWYIGPEDSPTWKRAVITGKPPNLFSVSSASDNNGQMDPSLLRPQFRSRLLRLRPCSVPVARLNSECARALWASVSLELLYLTNDDDERYSIQAEEHVLRNLTVQAADPPLGYAVYSSEPLRRTMEVN